MKYVSLAKSRAGTDRDTPKPRKRAAKPAPEKSVDKAESNNPDGGSSASQRPEEG